MKYFPIIIIFSCMLVRPALAVRQVPGTVPQVQPLLPPAPNVAPNVSKNIQSDSSAFSPSAVPGGDDSGQIQAPGAPEGQNGPAAGQSGKVPVSLAGKKSHAWAWLLVLPAAAAAWWGLKKKNG